MITQIIKEALTIKPISQIKRITDEGHIHRLFFSHQGRKYCSAHKHPPLNEFKNSRQEISRLGFFVDAGEIIVANDTNVGLIGSTSALLLFTDNTKVYKITLMHGASARIHASNYTVLLIANIDGCDLEIQTDNTVLVL